MCFAYANLTLITLLFVYLCLGRVGGQVIIPYRGNEYDCNQLKVMGDLGQILLFVSSILTYIELTYKLVVLTERFAMSN